VSNAFLLGESVSLEELRNKSLVEELTAQCGKSATVTELVPVTTRESRRANCQFHMIIQ